MRAGSSRSGSSRASSSTTSLSRSIEEHLSHEDDIMLDHIAILKNGYSYIGQFSYTYQAYIPTWLHKFQHNLPTNEFKAFVVLNTRLHMEAIMEYNPHVEFINSPRKIQVRMRISPDTYYVADHFEVYNINEKEHGPGLLFGTEHYPASHHVYIKWPDRGRDIIYRSPIEEGSIHSNTIEIKLMNGTCYYGTYTVLVGQDKKVPDFLHAGKRSNEFLAFTLLPSSLHLLAKMQRNGKVVMPESDHIVARMRLPPKNYYLALYFTPYDVDTRRHGSRGVIEGSLFYPDKNYVYITVPEYRRSVVYRSPLQSTEHQALSTFM
ncbi:uncharacterized protein LOC117182018 [Belonocnema kinseyi]|uniref:uncharacterized protein LOC117182018 n=1 Tax=Belonocnema kinseyi TaxID=2817044 RepID=UPI00143CCBB5|nr:uncharacterized protein LOC117182018 [Belonocnema kinseyi]